MNSSDSARIWIVDDDRSVRFVLAAALEEAGYAVTAFERASDCLHTLETTQAPEFLFTDVRMPDMDGLQFLEQFKQRAAHVPVVVISAYTDVESTSESFRKGALDFLSKPFDLDEAVALTQRTLQRDESKPATSEQTDSKPTALMGNSIAMRQLYRAIGRLAQTSLTTLILGETGTGKELVARALHQESPRARQAFVALNTAAIPAELLESELFGHEAGAFTGAQKRHIGRFEQAHGGTLFLDEIGDMPLPLQTRLLRVLAEGEFFRVGGRELIKVNVRLIAATHQNLEALIEQGKFRADLYHRLNVVRLQLPPLRERVDDIAILAPYFLQQAAVQFDAPTKSLSATALKKLQSYHWPGNVRELENACRRLAAMSNNETITSSDLHFLSASSDASIPDWESALASWTQQQLASNAKAIYTRANEQADRVIFETALEYFDGHRAVAAERLGVGRNAFTRKLGSKYQKD